MGAPLGGGNQVNVAFHHRFATFREPLDGPVHSFLVTGKAAGEWLQRYRFDVCQLGTQVITQTAFITPFVLVTGLLLQEGDVQARAKYGLGPQVMAQAADGEFRAVKVAGIRGELQPGTGVTLAHGVDNCKVGFLVAICEGHPVQLPVALDQYLKMGRQGVDH